MKTLNLLLLFIMFTTYSQTYNSWEIEGHIGGYKTTVGTANNYHNYVGTPFSIDLGITHYVTPTFGLKISSAYFNLKSNSRNTPFRTHYGRISALGSYNMRQALNLDKWYGLRLDLGLGYTEFYPKINTKLKNRERAGHIIGTLTNVIRINNRLNINAAIELISHYNMNITFDGTVSTGDPLDQDIGRNTGISDGTIYNFKIGLSYGFKPKTYKSQSRKDIDNLINNEIKDAFSRIEISKDTIIKNYHNHYHQIEFDPYMNKVFFKFNKYSIGIAQANVLDKIYLKMKYNPEDKLTIVGYADYRGSEGYNLELARKRAKAVFEFLVSAGISPLRLNYIGNGERPDFSNSEPTTQLDRVVYFIKNE